MGTAAVEPANPRRDRLRQQTVDEALDHAVQIMTEQGVGALTISEVARRMGMRGPSLYKYFSSLHAVYDLLFARGVAGNDRAVRQAIAGITPGVEAIRVGTRATVRWCVENPALSQLLYWRVVPGFEPSPATFADSRDQMREIRTVLAEAVRRRELVPTADSDEAARMLTVVISGLITQQMANQPAASYDDGLFTVLADEAIEMFFDHYRRTTKGNSDAATRQRRGQNPHQGPARTHL